MCFWSCTAKKIGTRETQPPTKRVDMVFKHIISQMIKGHTQLVGGFNPFEKYESNWESSPNFGVKIKKSLKPPPRQSQVGQKSISAHFKTTHLWIKSKSGLFETGLTSNKKHTHCYLLHLPYIAAKKITPVQPLFASFTEGGRSSVGQFRWMLFAAKCQRFRMFTHKTILLDNQNI